MSDNWIALIPEDPRFVPDAIQQILARDLFADLAPESDEVKLIASDRVMFFDCGTNLNSVSCPSCGQEISIDWWQAALDRDFENEEFQLRPYSVPCCSASHTLHELQYDWPQGFGRFAIDAMNPNIGKLDEQNLADFERILDCKLRVIYQHI